MAKVFLFPGFFLFLELPIFSYFYAKYEMGKEKGSITCYQLIIKIKSSPFPHILCFDSFQRKFGYFSFLGSRKNNIFHFDFMEISWLLIRFCEIWNTLCPVFFSRKPCGNIKFNFQSSGFEKNNIFNFWSLVANCWLMTSWLWVIDFMHKIEKFEWLLR